MFCVAWWPLARKTILPLVAKLPKGTSRRLSPPQPIVGRRCSNPLRCAPTTLVQQGATKARTELTRQLPNLAHSVPAETSPPCATTAAAAAKAGVGRAASGGGAANRSPPAVLLLPEGRRPAWYFEPLRCPVANPRRLTTAFRWLGRSPRRRRRRRRHRGFPRRVPLLGEEGHQHHPQQSPTAGIESASNVSAHQPWRWVRAPPLVATLPRASSRLLESRIPQPRSSPSRALLPGVEARS